MSLNKENLWKALREGDPKPAFAHGGEIDGSLHPLPTSLSVEGVPSKIGLPLSQEDASLLRGVAYLAPYSDTLIATDVWQMDCREVTFPDCPGFLNKVVHELAASALGKMMGMPAASVNVLAVPYKLLMYEQGDHFEAHREFEKEGRMFATMVVQLPTRCGHEGGALLVHHGDECLTFNCSVGSNTKYFETLFFCDCEHELQEVKQGLMLCLIFNLVRCDDVAPVFTRPIKSTTFIGALSRVEAELLPWIKELELPHHASKGSKGLINLLLAIPLSHMYSKNNLCFAGLKGHDRVVADLLQSAAGGALDVHLAMLTKHTKYNSIRDEDEKVYKEITEYTVGEWVAPDTNLLAKSFSEVSFDLDNMADEHHTEYYANEGSTSDDWYCVGVLVIWPRSSSVQAVNSLFGLEAAMDLWEQKYKSNFQDERAIKDIGDLVRYWPQRDWECDLPYNYDTLNAYGRLAEACAKVGFREEALSRINIHISSKSMAAIITAYGMGEESVNKAIEERLEPSPSYNDLEWLADLAFELDDVGCHVEAAHMVSKLSSLPQWKYKPGLRCSRLHLLHCMLTDNNDQLHVNRAYDAATMVLNMKMGSELLRLKEGSRMGLFRRLAVKSLQVMPFHNNYTELVAAMLWSEDEEVVDALVQELQQREFQELLGRIVLDHGIKRQALSSKGLARETMKKLVQCRLEYLRNKPRYSLDEYDYDERLQLWHMQQSEVPQLEALLQELEQND